MDKFLLITKTECRLSSQLLHFSTCVSSGFSLYGKNSRKSYRNFTENMLVCWAEPVPSSVLSAVIGISLIDRIVQGILWSCVDYILSLRERTLKEYVYERKSCSRLCSGKMVRQYLITAP